MAWYTVQWSQSTVQNTNPAYPRSYDPDSIFFSGRWGHVPFFPPDPTLPPYHGPVAVLLVQSMLIGGTQAPKPEQRATPGLPLPPVQ